MKHGYIEISFIKVDRYFQSTKHITKKIKEKPQNQNFILKITYPYIYNIFTYINKSFVTVN